MSGKCTCNYDCSSGKNCLNSFLDFFQMCLITFFRSNAQIKKVDTVHAQDFGSMSAGQLTSKINDNKKRDRKIAAEMQYVLYNCFLCALVVVICDCHIYFIFPLKDGC